MLRFLTEEQQFVVVAKFVEDRSNAEIAQLMDKPEGAIKSLQHRALATLRRAIEKVGCYEHVIDRCSMNAWINSGGGKAWKAAWTAHPQEASELRPLLEAAASLRSVPVQHASSAAFQKGRECMFAAIDQEFPREAVSKNSLSRYTVQIITWITGKENIDMKLVTRFAVAIGVGSSCDCWIWQDCCFRQ